MGTRMSRLEPWRMYNCFPEPWFGGGARGRHGLGLYLMELPGILGWTKWLIIHVQAGESDGSIWLFILDLRYMKYSFC